MGDPSSFALPKNNFCGARNFRAGLVIVVLPVGGQLKTMNMRALALGLFFSAIALPCFAQTVLKSEPFVLSPYEIAFVQDASCPAGKVLKVTGAIRGLHRRKACVTLATEQASLAVATP